METVDWDDMHERISRWFRRDGKDFPPALTEAQVHEAEAQFGVALPDDYRQYLLRVSAGAQVRELRCDQGQWHWAGDSNTDLDRLKTPFPDHDAALAASNEIWSQQPREEEYASVSAYQDAQRAWWDAYQATEEARTTGAIFLRSGGCDYETLLVVSGPMRGTMWSDERAYTDRIDPILHYDGHPATFAEWYAYKAW
ncbi:SMI1/KNR4 family protein [Actinoallomurus purpureus]|uniref:SMI1/KNR4 family protein n=1 Tax=Actinoallomurus purpureus TaxID=478114 RepID=UPI002092BFD1|nr:SMI1/KNR4 family protein [Actinoallomurus purpureus]MCO6010577.1 SMI1/KNR4 family protein [Actinoallomurus purpureus]